MYAQQAAPVAADSAELAHEIVKLLFYRRRLLSSAANEAEDFPKEAEFHAAKVENFISTNTPVHMVLPAFPAKSPNRKKTLGIYPDLGEEIALEALNTLCSKIKEIYEPGARLTVCSDGRVFAELVKIPDADVTAYKHELKNEIAAKYRDVIDFFDLDDVFTGIADFDSLREELMISYGESLLQLKTRCKTDHAALEMYKGICRFLVEDFSGLPEFAESSKNAIQNVARKAAYRVIQRSNAWSRLLQEKFANSIRLSIHPQPRVSEKIGVYLAETSDAWRTPWHSVAVKSANSIVLASRHEAEASNALLVFKNGRPSHYTYASA